MLVGLQAGLATLGATLALGGFGGVIVFTVREERQGGPRWTQACASVLLMCVGVGLFVGTGTQGWWS